MRKSLYLLAMLPGIFIFTGTVNAQGIINKIRQKTTEKVNQRADDKIDNAIDKTLDEVEAAAMGDNDKEKQKQKPETTKAKTKTATTTAVKTNKDSLPSIKVYQNYDFVPGDKILFEDNFMD